MKVDFKDRSFRRAMFDAHSGRCFHTNAPISFDEMQIDHLIPKDFGGEDVLENLVCSSKRVNGAKSNLYDEELTERLVTSNKLIFKNRFIALYNKYAKRMEWDIEQSLKTDEDVSRERMIKKIST